jgi:hypothetical protein
VTVERLHPKPRRPAGDPLRSGLPCDAEAGLAARAKTDGRRRMRSSTSRLAIRMPGLRSLAAEDSDLDLIRHEADFKKLVS